MKKGLMRRGPRSWRMIEASSMPCRPPMPEPISTPEAIWSSCVVGFQPESSIAWSAAAIA
jgi:hypothetical protein